MYKQEDDERVFSMSLGNIVLIGFMGVGKGRTARAIAKATGRYALDCDDLIESYANKRIRKIFKDDGEQSFRMLEQKTAEWLQDHAREAVISTGGGFIGVPNIRKLGTLVYLHSDFEAIITSIKAHPNARKKIKKRPLLQDMTAAQALYEKRLPMYRTLADLEVTVTDRQIDSIAEEVVNRIGHLKAVTQ